MEPIRRAPWTDVRVAVDVVIFTIRDDVRARRCSGAADQRGIPPVRGRWALPGGFVLPGESLEQRGAAASSARRPASRTSTSSSSTPSATRARPARAGGHRRVLRAGRAPTGAARSPAATPPTRAGGRSARCRRSPSTTRRILEYALERLRNKLEYTTVGFELLPPKFTLTQLQRGLRGHPRPPLDKRNFRGGRWNCWGSSSHSRNGRAKARSRPAQLFTFSAKRFERLEGQGNPVPVLSRGDQGVLADSAPTSVPAAGVGAPK